MSRFVRVLMMLPAVMLTLAACSDVSGPGGRVPPTFSVRMYGPETGSITGNTPASPGTGQPAGAIATRLDTAVITLAKSDPSADGVRVFVQWSRRLSGQTLPTICRIELEGIVTPVYGSLQSYPVRYAPGGTPGRDTLGFRFQEFDACRRLSTEPINVVVPQDFDEADGTLFLNLRVTGDSAGSADAVFVGSVAGTGYVMYSPTSGGEERIRFDLSGGISNFEKRRDGSVYANGAYVGGGGSGTPSTSPDGPFPVGTIVCPNVPSGYLCVTRNEQTVPIRLMPPGVSPAVYINTGIGVCMTLGSAGASSFRYEPGQGPGGVFTETGRWGALVASTGVINGTPDGRQIYLLTGSGDSQIALLLYDTVQRLPVGGGWTRGGTCPYR